MPAPTFTFKSNRLFVLDQRLLPHKTKYIVCKTANDVAKTIKEMAVRGAPAIGCVAAYGMALSAIEHRRPGMSQSRSSRDPGQKFTRLRRASPRMTDRLKKAAQLLKKARPTAVNLAWAVDRVLSSKDFLNEARRIEKEDVAMNKAMGRHGVNLLKKNSIVLTHCNAGALATAGYGTALGIIRAAHNKGKIKKVLIGETRPYLQGARLTAWECAQERIPHELITDNMAAHLMKTENVDAVIVGCDRVAANGDVANKIGTYSLAVLAKHHKIPFYVAMPSSTFDPQKRTGKSIPIEERSEKEVTHMGKIQISPSRTKARHPAFDITPASLITAIISDRGVVKFPNKSKMARLFKQKGV